MTNRTIPPHITAQCVAALPARWPGVVAVVEQVKAQNEQLQEVTA